MSADYQTENYKGYEHGDCVAIYAYDEDCDYFMGMFDNEDFIQLADIAEQRREAQPDGS